MLKMTRGELTKLAKRKMTWILLGVMVVYFCLIFFAIYGIAINPPERMPAEVQLQIEQTIQFPGAFDTIYSTAGDIMVLLLIILAASSIGSEYGWGSIRQILVRRGQRYQLVLSKLMSFIIIMVIGLVLALLTGFVLAVITSNMLGNIEWGFLTASFIGGLAENFGWTLFTLLPFIMLATFFAFLGRSPIAGIGGALGFYIIEAILVGILSQSAGWLGEIPSYLISTNVDNLVPVSMFAQGPLMPTAPDVSILHSTIVLVVYCVLLLVGSLCLFSRRDIKV